MCDIYNDAEDQYMCLERAAFFLERLDAELPKFAKCMLPSNVLYSFWLVRIDIFTFSKEKMGYRIWMPTKYLTFFIGCHFYQF